MNLLPIIYFIVIFSGLNMSLQTVIQERNLLIEPDRVQHSLNQLALAQYQYYANEVSAGREGSYASDTSTLVSGGFLPFWEIDPDPDAPSRDRYSIDTASDNLTLRYKVDNQHDAGRIAARLGSVARPVDEDGDGDTDAVEVAYSRPIDAALMGIFLPRDASLPMTAGPLTTKDLIVEGKLTVRDASTLEDVLTVTEDALTVTVASTLEDALTVTGISRMNGRVMANDGATLTGYSINLGNFDVVGGRTRLIGASTEVINNLEIGGSLGVGGSLTGAGGSNLVVGSDLEIGGSLTGSGGDLDVIGNLDISRALEVDNFATIRRDLAVHGTILEFNN